MPKRVKAWYDRAWLVPAVAILTFVSAPFLEDIRQAVPRRRWRDVGRLVFRFSPDGRADRAGCRAHFEERPGYAGLRGPSAATAKGFGGLRKLRHRGGALVDWIVTFAATAYNLVRMRTLVATCI